MKIIQNEDNLKNIYNLTKEDNLKNDDDLINKK